MNLLYTVTDTETGLESRVYQTADLRYRVEFRDADAGRVYRTAIYTNLEKARADASETAAGGRLEKPPMTKTYYAYGASSYAEQLAIKVALARAEFERTESAKAAERARLAAKGPSLLEILLMEGK